MNMWQQTPYTVPLLLAGLLSAALAVLGARRRTVLGAAPFIVLMVGAAVWSIGYAFELASTQLAWQLFWARVEYFGIVTVPVAWLIFTFYYTRQTRWLNRRTFLILSIVPVVTLLLVLTNDWHGLVWSETVPFKVPFGTILEYHYGPGFWLNWLYAYLTLLAGTGIIIWQFIRTSRLFRLQVGAILGAAMIPWLGNLLYVANWNPFPYLDLTPLAFALTGVVVAWALFYLGLLDVVPVARGMVVESLEQGVIVLDARSRVVDINDAACRFIDRSGDQLVGKPIDQVLSAQPDLVERYRDTSQAHEEIYIGEGADERVFDVQVTPLRDSPDHLAGRLIVLNEMTQRKRVEAELRRQALTFESISDSVIVTNLLGNIVDCNPATEHIFGYSKAEVMGRSPAVWHIGDLDTSAAAMIKSVQGAQRWENEVQFVRKDGRKGTCEVIAVPLIDHEGVWTAIIIVYHDITGRQQAEIALRAQMQLFENLVMVARMTAEQPSLQATLSRTLDMTVDLTRAQKGMLFLLTDSGRVERLIPAGGPSYGSSPLVVGQAVGQGIARWAIRYRQPVLIYDTIEDERWFESADAFSQARSALVVPIVRGTEVTGVVSLVHPEPGHFSPQDAYLMQAVLDQVALALRNAQLYEEARQQAADVSTLYTVTRMLSRSLSLEKALEQVLPLISAAFDMQVGVFAMFDPDNKTLRRTALWGSSLVQNALQDQRILDLFCANICAQERRILIDNSDTASQLSAEMSAALAEWGFKSFVGTPLQQRGECLGAMCLFARHPHTFSLRETTLLDAIGDQVATAFLNMRLIRVTAQERQRLLTLIESSRDGIIMIGIQGRLLVVNASALHLLRLPGYPADWMDRPLTDVLLALRHHAPHVVGLILSETRRISQGDDVSAEGLSELGQQFVHWSNFPVESGSMTLGRLWVLRDVTQEQQMVHFREDLTRTMVHDLRNPLTSISVSLSMLSNKLRDKMSPAQTRVLELGLSAVHKMLTLVNAILDVSRLESGRMPLDLTLANLYDLAAHTLSEQLILAAEKNLQLQNHVPPTLPLVYADATLIGRVLANLVDNAVKFTPNGGVIRIGAEVREMEQGDDLEPRQILVSVYNDGPPIPPDMLAHIFERFTTGGQQGSGSGLGLAFCRLAVEAHQGHIWAENDLVQGVTFGFTLPVASES